MPDLEMVRDRPPTRLPVPAGASQSWPIRLLFFTFALLAFLPAAQSAEFTNPQPVVIEGYDGDAMEPFLSRDGRRLFFNNRNTPEENTDLHWAEAVTPARFIYRGKISGVNTEKLEGVPSMDENGLLYFISTRSYFKTCSTVYRARFTDGHARDVQLVEGLSKKKRGHLIFDAEVSADGKTLIAVDGVFSGGSAPDKADLFIASRNGARFERSPDSAKIFANINTSSLEYAPSMSADGMELFFTRVTGALFWRDLSIMHAERKNLASPFGKPKRIDAIKGFVEAPALNRDGRSLYYHQKTGGTFKIYRVTRVIERKAR